MIREGKKLLPNTVEKIPEIVNALSGNDTVVALYAYGSLVTKNLKPLSDLDFGILLDFAMDKRERFDRHLDLIGTFSETFETDEIDLILMNDAPLRFGYDIIKTGKLLICNDRIKLIDYREHTQKLFLDFIRFRDEFDRFFLNGIGYYG